MKIFLRIVLHPISSLLLTCLLYLVMMKASIVFRIVAMFFSAVFYVALRPRVRRNVSLWRSLAPEEGISRIGEGSRSINTISKGINCVVVSFPLTPDIDVVNHALAFGKGSHLSQSTVMYVCRSSYEHMVFWLPLARIVLWYLGGFMQYSRGLLLQLLKRRSITASTSQLSNIAAVVLLPPIAPLKSAKTTNNNNNNKNNAAAATTYVAMVTHKSIFAAALKTASVVVPAFVHKDGTIDYGNYVTLSSSCSSIGEGGSSIGGFDVTGVSSSKPSSSPPSGAAVATPIGIPSPEQVQRVALQFNAELSSLFEKVTGGKKLLIR